MGVCKSAISKMRHDANFRKFNLFFFFIESVRAIIVPYFINGLGIFMWDSIITTLSSEAVLKWAGAIILSGLCFGLMRIRGRSVQEAACFSGGVLGFIILLSLIKYFLF